MKTMIESYSYGIKVIIKVKQKNAWKSYPAEKKSSPKLATSINSMLQNEIHMQMNDK